MPKYVIYYTAPIVQEAVIGALTKKEAITKVKEVIGKPIKIEQAWEIKDA